MAVTKPVVNGSSGTWGTILNAALDDLDTRITADVANLVTANTAITTNATNTTNLGTRVTALEGAANTKLIVATSGTRPAAAVGQAVLETDTGFLYYVVSIGGTPTRVPFPGSYLARMRRTTTQNIGNSSQNEISFSSADFDRLTGWSSGSPTRYTAKVAGDYEFSGMVSFAANSTGYRLATILHNGSNVPGAVSVVPAGQAVASTAVSLRPITVTMALNDYVELSCFHNGGATLATDATTHYQPTLQVKYLGYHV